MSYKSPESDSEGEKWPAKGIIDEKEDKYLVDWDGVDPETNEPYAPTWEPKKNCKELVAAWVNREKLPNKRGSKKEEGVEDNTEYAKGTKCAYSLILRLISHLDPLPSSFSDSVLTPGSTLPPGSKVGPPRGIKRVVDPPCTSILTTLCIVAHSPQQLNPEKPGVGVKPLLEGVSSPIIIRRRGNWIRERGL